MGQAYIKHVLIDCKVVLVSLCYAFLLLYEP